MTSEKVFKIDLPICPEYYERACGYVLQTKMQQYMQYINMQYAIK